MIPAGADVLCAQMQGVQLCLWILVDSDAETEIRTFDVYGTGNPLPAIDLLKNTRKVRGN